MKPILKKSRLIIWMLVLVAGVILLRLPSFYEPHWYDDEEIYLTIGANIAKGRQLYVDIVDHKPPLLYWWTAINPTTVWIKFSATVFMLLAAIMMVKLGRAMKLKTGPLILAIVSFVLMTNLPAFEGNIFNAELMFIPLSLLGVYLWWTKRWPVLVGLIFGVASLIKVPVLADFAAILTLSLYFFRFRQVIIMGAAAILPWLTTGLIFSLKGNFGQFWYYSIAYNFQYVKDWSLTFNSPVLTAIGSPLLRGLLLLLGLTAAMIAGKRYKAPNSLLLVLVWFWWSWFGSLLSVRPYPHYYLQLAPAIALGLGLLISTINWKARLVTAACLLLFPVFIQTVPVNRYRTWSYYDNWFKYVLGQRSYPEYVTWFRGIALEHADIAEYISKRSNTNETVFVWGNAAAIYSQTPLPPTTPYITDFLIYSLGSYEEVTARLQEAPPRWIAVCNKDRGSFPELFQLLDSTYLQVKSYEYCRLFLKTPLAVLQ